jgi:HEAT repeat protein
MKMVGLQRKWRTGLVVILALSTIGVLLYVSRTNEPSFQGRALSQWLEDIENARDDQAAEPANNAVRQIGTNAIPYLLEMMRAEDSQLKETFNTLVARAHIYRFRIPDASGKHACAFVGFCALGPQAGSAIPELTVLVNNPKLARFAAAALIYISPDGVKAATSGLENTNALVRREILGVLGTAGIVRFTTNATPARMAILGAQAEFAVPPMIRALSDSDELTRARAATSLGLLGQKPEIVVPALIRNLAETNGWRVPVSAAKGLSRFGTNAGAALPALKAIAGHPDSRVREAVATAIQSIETPAEPRLE